MRTVVVTEHEVESVEDLPERSLTHWFSDRTVVTVAVWEEICSYFDSVTKKRQP